MDNSEIQQPTEIRRVFTHDDLLNIPMDTKLDIVYNKHHDTWLPQFWHNFITGLDNFFSPCAFCKSKFTHDRCTLCGDRVCYWCQDRENGWCIPCQKEDFDRSKCGQSNTALIALMKSIEDEIFVPGMSITTIKAANALTNAMLSETITLNDGSKEYDVTAIVEGPTSGVVSDEDGIMMMYGGDK